MDALHCFAQVLAKVDQDKTIYVAQGTLYQDMGNHQAAIQNFSRALDLDNDLSIGFYRRGVSKF